MPGSLGAKTDTASPRLALEAFRFYCRGWAPAPVPPFLTEAPQSRVSGVLQLEGSRAPWSHRLPPLMCCAAPGR
eukprot:8367716-Pyramimonas_sp.AAC.1